MAGTSGGKRAGSRRGPRPQRRLRPHLLLLALGITACVIAWGYLVYAAIDFGTTARNSNSTAWWFLGLASLGAVSCLFVGLLLVARLLRGLRLTSSSSEAAGEEHPRPVGGRRAAR